MSESAASSAGIASYVYELSEKRISFNKWDVFPRLQPPSASPLSLIDSLIGRVKAKTTSMALPKQLAGRILKRAEEMKNMDNAKIKKLLLKKLVDLYLTVVKLPNTFVSSSDRDEWIARLTQALSRFEDKMLHLIEITKPPRVPIKVEPPLQSLKVIVDATEKIQFVMDKPTDDVALLWRKATSLKELLNRALVRAESAHIPKRYFEMIRESLAQIEFCLCEEASVPVTYRRELVELIELLERSHPFDLELILNIKILRLKSVKCIEETDAKHSLQMEKLETTVRHINEIDPIERTTPHAYWLSNQLAPLKSYPQPDDDLKLLTFLGDEKHRVEKETLLKEYEDKHLAFERRDLAAERAKRNACLRRKIEAIKRKLISEDRRKVFEPKKNLRAMPECQQCQRSKMKIERCCDKACCTSFQTGSAVEASVYRPPAASLGCSRLTRKIANTNPAFICHGPPSPPPPPPPPPPTFKNEAEPSAITDELKTELTTVPTRGWNRRNFDRLNKLSTPIHYMELDPAVEKLFQRMSKRKVKQMAAEKAIEDRKNRLRSDSGVCDKERWRKWMLEMQETMPNAPDNQTQ